MGQPVEYVDPYGAPELFVNGVAYREWAAGGLIRSGFFAWEQGLKVIRVKLLIEAPICAIEHQAMQRFVSHGRAGPRLVK